MPGGSYSALSGMQQRLADLDRVAADLANIGTAGYKAERAASNTAERPSFGALLDSAAGLDVAVGEGDEPMSGGACPRGASSQAPPTAAAMTAAAAMAMRRYPFIVGILPGRVGPRRR